MKYLTKYQILNAGDGGFVQRARTQMGGGQAYSQRQQKTTGWRKNGKTETVSFKYTVRVIVTVQKKMGFFLNR